MDKAGGYGIQDHTAPFFVQRIEGDYYRRVKNSNEVSLSADASFPLVQGYRAPEDTTGAQDGGRVGW